MKSNRQSVDRWLVRFLSPLLCVAMLVSLCPANLTAAPVARAESANTAADARPVQQAPRGQPCPLFGDVDCNCKVETSDVQAYAARWGAASGEANYDPAFDVDNNGVINVSDVLRISAHLGDVCPVSGANATIVGSVINAATDTPLAGVSVHTTNNSASTTSDSQGHFALAVLAGEHEIEFTRAGFTGDQRLAVAEANRTVAVQDVRLYPLDTKSAVIGTQGGLVVNSADNSSLEFPAGALATTQNVRVTYLPNDGLPGDFVDGSIPMGFSSFEPEGVVFPQGKEVLWTVVYTGTLPVGTDTLCYWWDGKEGRWRDPVPGKVVQLDNGKKALQARVPHFSAYGHALPGIAGQRPGSGGDATSSNANSGEGGKQCRESGCEINLGAGSVSESYLFSPVSGRGFPLLLAIRYSTSNDTPTVTARVPFAITTQMPASASWKMEFQGKTYTGQGYTAQATWDTRNALGYRVAPGLYPYKATETFYYDSGAQPSLSVNGQVEVRRGDIWPFGYNWFSGYDTLLVDQSGTVTIIQGDGQQLTYTRQANGSYTAPPEDFSTLVHNGDGTWLRTSKQGGKESFNAQGRLIRLEDRNGNAHTLVYASNGVILANGQWGLTTRLTSITDVSGRATTFTYGSDGYINTVIDAVGRSYNLTHDAAGNLTGITDPLGRVTSYQYDANHLLTRYVHPKGNATTLTYDGERRVTGHRDALDQQRAFTYGNSQTTATNERGSATTYAANAQGLVTQVSNPVQTFNYTYDNRRQLTAIDQPPQSFSYDARGNLTSHSNFARTTTTYEATFNQPTSTTDPVGGVTTYSYDAKGNLSQLTDALGQNYKFAYDDAGQPIGLTDPLNNTVTLAYDAFGNITQSTDALGYQTTFLYDAVGNLTKLTDAEGRITQSAYDTMGRLTTATDALGQTSQYAYDANDNLTQVTDGRSNITTYAYDALNRPVRKTDPLGRQTNYTYDGVGNLTGLTDANGALTQFTYDAANRLVQEQGPAGAVTYAYDASDNPTSIVGPSTRMTYTYPTGIPASPDVVETLVLANPAIHTTITYDYVAVGSTAALATSSASEGVEHAMDAGQPTPPLNQEAYANAATSPISAPPSTEEAYSGAPTQKDAADVRPVSALVRLDTVKTGAPVTADLKPYSALPGAVATNVCGVISTNTTWSLANSPYLVTCDVTVNAGVTLTVDPGVVVKFGFCCATLYVNGALTANGTADQPITFTSVSDDSVGGDSNNDGNASTPAPGNWGAIRFSNTSTGSVLNHAVVRYGGGYWIQNVYVNTSDITLTNSTFAYSYGNGLVLDNALPASLTGNTFLNNNNSAVWAPLTNNTHSIALSGNSASGNQYNGFVTSGSIGGNVTWDGDDNFPFIAYYDLTVNSGARLTLAPRTTVKFAYCCLTLYVNGALVADANAANPITFTSLSDDSVGGDSNNDGNASTPAPGNWGAIRFSNTSTGSVLNHAVVRYGGGYWIQNVYVNTSDITLTNSTFAYSYGNGLVLDNALPASLTGNTFLNNNNSAVWAPLTNNTHSIALSGNSASGNQYNGFVTSGSIGGNVTWDGDDNFPFIAYYDLTVNSGARLTLAPRTTVKFAYCCLTLYVNGALVADANAANPITFTSLSDDSVGGDSNNDGNASTPAPGNWGAIRFSNTSTGSVLNHAVVRYGGGYWIQNVYVNTSDITLTNSTFAHSYGSGLVLDAASPTLTGNTIRDNAVGVYAYNGAGPTLHENRIIANSQFGVQNAGGAAMINAEDNWWGSGSGPLDASDDRGSGGLYNPNGGGDKVSNGVDYDPWLQATGLLYGATIATGANPIQTMSYSYNAASRLISLMANGPASLSYGYSYDAASRLTSVIPDTGSPGVRVALEYDANARLTRIINRSPDSAVTFDDLRTTYDKLGNVLTTQNSVGTTTYTYDAIYRLTSVSGPGINETYAYDATGNRTARNAVTYSYNAANQLVSSSDGVSYAYDDNGNLKTKSLNGQTTTFTWNANDRLTRIDFPDGSFAAYTYDALGRRLSKRDRAGVTIYYVYDGLNLAQEVNSSGVVIASYVHDSLDHPLSMTRDGFTYSYLYDRLGSVIGLTDGGGVLVASYRYDPWGNLIATGGSNPTLTNPFRFAGREFDVESGLYSMRARFYDPQTGRFLSKDALNSANAYAYADNNPVVFHDPMGHEAFDRHWWQAVGGFGVGVGVGILAGAAAVGAAPLAAVGIFVGGIVAGGAAGGTVAVASEAIFAGPCDRDFRAAFGAGFRGGMTGGAVGGYAGYYYGAEIGSAVGALRGSGSAVTNVLRQRVMIETNIRSLTRMATEAAAKGDMYRFDQYYTKIKALQATLAQLPIYWL
jgi:RHS repeat-associated protein